MRLLNTLLGDPNKKIHEAHGVLAKFYRLILRDNNVTVKDMDRMLQHWLNNPENDIPEDSRTRSFLRGNLTKALAMPDMTWKTFLRGLMLHRVKWIEIDMKVGYQDVTRSHHMRVFLDDDSVRELSKDVPVEGEEDE